MDPEMQKKLDDAIAAALAPVAAKLRELESSNGQVAEAVRKIGEMEGNLKILSDTVAKVPPADPEAIRKIVGETITAQQAEQAKAAAAQKAKGDWLAKNAPKLPETYRAMIPDTDDAAKLEEAGKAALAKFEKEFKETGVAVPSPADAGEGGKAPGTGGGAGARLDGVAPHIAKMAEAIVLPSAAQAPAK